MRLEKDVTRFLLTNAFGAVKSFKNLNIGEP